jgi:hypothetical protein
MNTDMDNTTKIDTLKIYTKLAALYDQAVDLHYFLLANTDLDPEQKLDWEQSLNSIVENQQWMCRLVDLEEEK